MNFKEGTETETKPFIATNKTQMTPREALVKKALEALNWLFEEAHSIEGNAFQSRSYFDTLYSFITATEQVPTLEKLGYKEEKSDKDLQLLKHYVKDSLQINFVKLFGKVLVVKWNNGNVVAIADDELLACAEIIKQMENTK